MTPWIGVEYYKGKPIILHKIKTFTAKEINLLSWFGNRNNILSLMNKPIQRYFYTQDEHAFVNHRQYVAAVLREMNETNTDPYVDCMTIEHYNCYDFFEAIGYDWKRKKLIP